MTTARSTPHVTKAEQAAFSYADAALYAGMSKDEIRRAMRRGDLPCYYPTSRPMFKRSDLDNWIASWPSTPIGRAS